MGEIITIAQIDDTYTSATQISYELVYSCGVIRNLIPKYSHINAATFQIEAAENLKTSEGDLIVKIGGSGGKTIIKKVGWIAYDYDLASASILPYVYTDGANAGNFSGYEEKFYVKGSASLFIRKWYFRKYKVTMDVTKPTYTLSIVSNNTAYGTVTGGGTYTVQTYDQTSPITATPRAGYKFVKWSDGNTNATRNFVISQNGISSQITSNTLTAEFAPEGPTIYKVNFRTEDGTITETRNVESGGALGTIPKPTKPGYTFNGWVNCAPVKKTDGTILNSEIYDGSTTFALDKKYKYTDKFSLHIEAYMDDWTQLSQGMQLISCTQSGGWGLGYGANTVGHGAEVYSGSYIGIDLGFGSTLTGSGWKEFDLVYNAGKLTAYINGTNKGSVTNGTSIMYNADNTIFVGAEAGTNDSFPDGSYFTGIISNVFIAHSSSRITNPTATTKITSNRNYYPVWRKNTSINNIYIGGTLIKDLYIGTEKIKAVYVGTTKIYG